MNRLSAIFSLACLMTFSCGIAGAQSGPGNQAATLNDIEKSDLIFIREEEKLARDTYSTLSGVWGEDIFANIAVSEQNHMDAVYAKFVFFGIEDEDPVVDDSVGAFINTDLRALFLDLTDDETESLLMAYKAGALIEETDIHYLRLAISNTDKTTLINTYENLKSGSYNHLRAFVAHITGLGVEYEAQVLDSTDVEKIVGGYDIVPGAGFSMNAGLNGAWYYPGTSGQGFFITVYPEQQTVFLGWFTFDTEVPPVDATANLGDPGQRWITAQGRYSGGLADLAIYVSASGIFDSGSPAPEISPSGSILLQFNDCASGSVTYDIPSIDRAGVVPIERIVPDNIALCQELNASSQ